MEQFKTMAMNGFSDEIYICRNIYMKHYSMELICRLRLRLFVAVDEIENISVYVLIHFCNVMYHSLPRVERSGSTTAHALGPAAV
jgi:hypothetical protein